MLTDDKRNKLIQVALNARNWAYAPYSNYKVGAAVLTNSGRVYDGVNVENAAYPATMCAERAAIFKAVSDGERNFDAVVVATENAGAPCGTCRQVMVEFGLDTTVILVNDQGEIVQETDVRNLLPGAFTEEDLT